MSEYLSLQENIFGYVKKNTLVDSNKLNNKTLLFREGIFDSMAFVLLIDYLEENFNIKLTDEDLIEENFESIEAIIHFVSKKKGINI